MKGERETKNMEKSAVVD